MCGKNKTINMLRERAIIEWSQWSDLGEWPLMMLVNLVNSWLCLLTVTTRVISSGELYCFLLPQCKALRTSVVYRIRILESNPARYLEFFGFGLDIVFLSTGFGSGLSKLKKSGRAKILCGIIVVWGKITIFRIMYAY